MSSTTTPVAGGAIINGESMAASITSDVVTMDGRGAVGVQVQADSGTHVGTLTLQISNDKTNWTTVSFALTSDGTIVSSLAASSGAAFQHFIEVIDCAAKYLRAAYAYTSGTGTLYVYAHRK